MAGERPQHSLQKIFQNAAGSLLVVAVVGIWNAAANTSAKLDDLTASMGGLRRDVDRHESILMRLRGFDPEAVAEQRRETGRIY